MDILAQSKASWAEHSPAVAALAAIRSRRILSIPHGIKTGFKDSSPHITVIENFHGTVGLNGTAQLSGTGLLGGAGSLKSAGQLNGHAGFNDQVIFARVSGATAAIAAGIGPTDAQRLRSSVHHDESMPGPRLEARTRYSSEPAQPSPRSVGQLPRPEHLLAAGPELTALLEDGAALLDSARLSATAGTRLLGFVEAADFAGRVEEISRSVEYLQIVAAQAVERARKEAQQAGPGSSAAAPEWRTGWTDPVPGTKTALASTRGAALSPTAALSTGDAVTSVGGAQSTGSAAQSVESAAQSVGGAGSRAGVLDDGYRDAAQFLRARLRIGIGEARRRLALATNVLPQAGMTGQEIPARRETLAQAVGSALVPSRSATIISTALDKIRHLTPEDTITRMEHSLTTTAVETDPDFVTTMTKRWIDSIDQNGPEPSEEVLRQHQGAFLRKRRRYGLHHIEIFATDEQYETLTTVMNTATNPRLTTTTTPDTGTGNDNGTDTTTPDTSTAGTGNGTDTTTPADTSTAGTGSSAEPGGAGPQPGSSGPDLDLDLRTRAQKLLNGLVGACSVALTTAKLPANGGYRPQLAITIGYQELLGQVNSHNQASQHKQRGTDTATGTDAGAGAGLGTGTATFLGPIHPNTIRKIACDADILPVLLGSDSRVLDIGRTTRIFPPHIRKAITARDQGCAFPDCTMPAPWCEAHHTTYWSHGGTTSTDNGTLLCSHHHHLIHKEQWRINMKTGVPWFIPPPHIDPHQTPRRNHHHTPQRT
ncbi:HNH endonuclease signature motif containing protein [Arthrobacter sp. 31Y]|uniref:HNH endonuclease signature motif containing protein n=1 Tax=Arthrobacter sp. 31Y TaxID=1115632 RepID=UPI0004649BB8|nr:HNH endonuclease signature motif containing protein [Arthrobacter sp. 31Y]